jgi:AraC-like DNA-binding protein
MGQSPVSWVPPGAWLAPGYAEWQAPAALRGPVACLWARLVPDGDDDHPALVLPDGCSDLIWEQGVGAYVAGPDTGPVRTETRPGTVFVGVRFRPAAGGQVLGLPLSELRDRRVPLADLRPGAARGLPATLSPAAAAARVLDVTGALLADGSPDPAISAAASLLRDPAARTEDIAGRVGLSERQFRRRSHAAAGYGPKTLQRVLRFQRFVRLLDAANQPPDLAELAAATGYADQPHLTRECGVLSGLTPAALARARRPPGGELPLPEGGKLPDAHAEEFPLGVVEREAARALQHVGGQVPGQRPDRASG